MQSPATICDYSKRWPLIGREAELRQFSATIEDQRSRGFIVYGPAGVGKSCLAEACLALASRSKFTVHRATASAAAAKVPLGAIAHFLPSDTDLSDPVAGR
ncbi:ATP-binding protein, partial [Streptomyces chryseus]